MVWVFIELPELFIPYSTVWLLQASAIVFFCVGGLAGIQLETRISVNICYFTEHLKEERAYTFTACSVFIIPKCTQNLYSIDCRMELFPSLNRIICQALFCRSSPMHALSRHALIRLQNCNVSLCV